jgi:hypothetical protein
MKDQKDFDLEQIVSIIDQALESDDQRIKDALRALMTITVLCTAQHPDQALRNGPFARLLEDYNNLARRLSRLEDEVTNVKNRMPPATAAPYTPPSGSPFVPNPNTGWPGTVGPWIGTNPNGPKPMWGPSWTSAGDDPEYKGATSSKADISVTMYGMGKPTDGMLAEEFLKELESK